MKLKPKTVRRLTLLGVVAALGAGAAVALLFVRTAQIEAITDRLRADGMAAHEAGEHFEALSLLGRYLRRAPEDAEALLAYADSRRKIEEADGRHVVESIGVLQRYLVLRPDDREVKEELLGLYNRAGYYPEARGLAGELRPERLEEATDAQLGILRQEAIALLGLSRHEEAGRVLGRARELAPADMETWLLRVELGAREGNLAGVGTSAADLEAQGVEPARALLMRALVLLRGEIRDDVIEAERILGEIAASDATFHGADARVFATALDRVGRHEDALGVLRGLASEGDADARLAVARRRYQLGRMEALEESLRDVDPAHPASSALLLGLKGLVASERGRREEAEEIRSRLSEREADFRAEAWSIVLRQAIERARTTTRERIAALRKATEIDPHETIIRALLADALASAGRHVEAAEAWREVVRSPASAGWAAAGAHLAESLLHVGEVEGALEAARAAWLTSPDNVLANVVLLEAEAEAIDSGLRKTRAGGDGSSSAEEDPSIERLVTYADRVWEAIADEASGVTDEIRTRAATARIALLASLDLRERAMAAIESLKETPAIVTPLMIERLTRMNDRERLGALPLITDLAGSLDESSPAVALAKAMRLARAGRPEEGLDLIDSMALTQYARPEQWGVARAEYLSRIGDERARSAWRNVADAHPDSARVQRAALLSPAAAQDRTLVERCIRRYTELTGASAEEDVMIRLAMARSTLAGAQSMDELDEAIAGLRRLVAERPGVLDGRVLLASALIRRAGMGGKGPEAFLLAAREQFTAALAVAPASAPIALELARVHRMLGESDESIARLRSVAQNPRATREQRIEAARLLRLEGAPDDAARALAAYLQEPPDDGDPDLLIALTESALAADDTALIRRGVDALLRADLHAPGLVARAASLVARAGDEEGADRILATLDRLELDEAERLEWRGRYAEAIGAFEEAAEKYESALTAGGGEDVAHRLTILHIATGEDARAQELITSWAERSGDIARLEPLVRVLARDELPSDAERLLRRSARVGNELDAAALARQLSEGVRSGRINDAAWLHTLADGFARAPGVRAFVARRLASLGGGHERTAVAMGVRAMHESPGDAESARLAAELLLREERWEEMLAAARAWRGLVSEPRARKEADVAIAQAQLRLGRPVDAAGQLRVWASEIGRGEIDPVDLGVLNVLGAALIASGRTGEAESLLSPLIETSPGVRLRVWLPLAAAVVPDVERARAWIDRASSLARDRAGAEQLAIATAYGALAARSGPAERAELLRVAEDALEPVKGGEIDGAAHETLGKIRDLAGDETGAERAYREAIRIDPGRTDALNNLSVILTQRPGKAAEAAEAARKAVEFTGGTNPAYLDTLATALEALEGSVPAERREAIRDEVTGTLERLAEVSTDPASALWRLARHAESWGRIPLARRTYRRLMEAPGAESDVVAAAGNNLAYLLLRAEEGEASHQEAYVLAQRAVGISPKAAFLDTLGHACVRTGRYEEAIETFERALRSDPEKPSSLLGLARAILESEAGDVERARSALQGIERAAAGGASLTPGQIREYEELRVRIETR